MYGGLTAAEHFAKAERLLAGASTPPDDSPDRQTAAATRALAHIAAATFLTNISVQSYNHPHFGLIEAGVDHLGERAKGGRP